MNREGEQPEVDELDALLGVYVRGRLDPQLGRAPAAFAAAAAAGRADRPPHRGGGGTRLAFAAAGLIAAMLMIAWAIWSAGHRQPPPVVTIQPVAPVGDAGPRELERLVLWQTVDDGAAVFADQLPVRKLRQEAVEQVQYYDPDDRATIRVTVPLVRDVMVQMETY